MGWLVLPRVINYLREQAPNTTLSVDGEYNRGIADELDAGLADLVVGTFPQIPDRFDSELLFSDRWVWVLRSDHPALATELTRAILLELPQLVIAINDVGRSIDGVVTEAGLERIVVADKVYLGDVTATSRYSAHIKGAVVINSAEAAPAILARSDLVGLLPQRLAEAMKAFYGLKVLRFDTDGAFDHCMIWHRKHGADPAVTWLRSAFRAVIGDLLDEPS